MKKSKLIFVICISTIILFINTANAQYVNLLNFAGTSNGSFPEGSLISDGTFLYGMTTHGGTNDSGTVFKIMPDGSGYLNLLNFVGISNGSGPKGSLIFNGAFLYGMTFNGGTNNLGTIFKIMPDGSGYVKLLDFNGAINGSNPRGELISDGTFLYGMTSKGGTNNLGTIFKIMPDGSGYVNLYSFTGSINGSTPWGSLILNGTNLYGMTGLGGINNLGNIFKIMSDGTGYTNLLDFDGGTNGSYPQGSLISDGAFLYGMTGQGGPGGSGTLFKIMPDGSSYTLLLDFADVSEANPHGSLISDGTFLYGMTNGSGGNDGNTFMVMIDGSGYVDLLSFGGSNGGDPQASLISDGTFLYGMTPHGGLNYYGTIFRLCNPPAVMVSNTGPYCVGDTIQLNSISGGIDYDWVGPGGYVQNNTQNPSIDSATIGMQGVYTVTVTNVAGCTSTSTTTVTINNNPVFICSNTGPYCVGDTIQLSIAFGGSGDWVGPNGFVQNDVCCPLINSATIVMNGIYTVTETNIAGCTSTCITAVIVNDNPSVNLGSDVVQSNPPAVVDAGSGFVTYYWNTTDTTQNIAVNTNGQYIVSVTNILGCTDSDTIQVNFTSGIINQDGTPTIISLYPNPTSNGSFSVSIQNIETSNLLMEFVDMNGRIIYNRCLGHVSGNVIEQVSLSELRMGIYVMRLAANGNSTQLRFTVKE